jgi:hypothetical protein
MTGPLQQRWRRWGAVKLIPLALAAGVSVLLPSPIFSRIIAGTILYLLLYVVTWRRADGHRVLPPYLW